MPHPLALASASAGEPWRDESVLGRCLRLFPYGRWRNRIRKKVRAGSNRHGGARRERQQRLERGWKELQKLRPSKPRVRVSEPEARRMRQADVGIAPNYTVQISADAAQSLIVDVQRDASSQ
jgi:hypothetical protein